MKKNNIESNSEATPEQPPAPAPAADPQTAADPPRESARIAAAISAAEARLTAIHDTDLPALDKERDTLAGAVELDVGAMAGLNTQRAVLLDEASTLRRRIELLSEQKEAAEKEEATARMSELTRAQQDLAAIGAGLKEQWDTLLTSLFDKSKELWPIIKRSQEMGYEKEWIKTRYTVALLPADAVARPTTQDLRPLEKCVDDLLRSTLDPWLIQKRDLLDARARAQPKPQGVYESRLFAVPEQPTVPATPPQPPPAPLIVWEQPPAETPPPAAPETHHPLSMAERSIRKEG